MMNSKFQSFFFRAPFFKYANESQSVLRYRNKQPFIMDYDFKVATHNNFAMTSFGT